MDARVVTSRDVVILSNDLKIRLREIENHADKTKY